MSVRSATRLRRLRTPRAARRHPRASLIVGVSIILGVLLLGVLRPLMGLPAPDTQNLADVLASPSWAHPFGTDNLGRDVLSRTLAAAHLDLAVAIALTLMSLASGVLLGALAGFGGRRTEAVIMRLADAMLAFPFMILVIAVVAVFGPGLKGVFVGVPLAGWAIYARVTRSEMLVVREKDYMLAARTLGYSRSRMLLRHALPNVWRPALVLSTADVVLNLVLLASLSYLGLGVQPPTPEWGGIIADGQQYLLQAWWISTLPGLVVVLVGAGFSLIGDGLADLLGQEVRLTA